MRTASIEERDSHDGGRGVLDRWPSWPTGFAALALVMLFAAAGFFVGKARDAAPTDASPEAGFARDMMTHHAQAVEMAEIVRQRTADPEIRTLATDIVLTQQAQIGRTMGWLETWNLPMTSLSDAMAWMGHPVDSPASMPGMASREDINALASMPPARMDVRFLQLMIPHHQAAILMARSILGRSDDDAVRSFASSVVTSQQAEIAAMRAMLTARGSEETEPLVSLPGAPMSSPSASHAGSHSP